MASSEPLGKFGMNKKLLQISPWVSRFADQIPSAGAVLDLACGGGRHSYFFLDRGHPVTAIDRDISALQPADNLEIIQHDLEDGGAASEWPLGQRQFAAVVVVNYLHRPLLPQLVAAVGQGGVLLYDTFAIGNEAFGRTMSRFSRSQNLIPVFVQGIECREHNLLGDFDVTICRQR